MFPKVSSNSFFAEVIYDLRVNSCGFAEIRVLAREYLGSPKVNQENIAGTRKNEGSPESFWVLRKVFPNLAGAPLGKPDLEKPFRRTQKPFWGNRNFDWWRQFFLIYLLESTSSPFFSRFWKLSHLNLLNSFKTASWNLRLCFIKYLATWDISSPHSFSYNAARSCNKLIANRKGPLRSQT